MGLDYKKAGVDIDAGNQAVELIKKNVQSTFGPEVMTGLGGFGGLFKPDLSKYKNPVLVSGTDGVGTKLKLAFKLDLHNTIGIDLVAMSVNDILAQGAEPLFFLDYLATGKLEPEKTAEIVKGIAVGCKEAGAALIGGETAEMAGFYQPGEYDLAGFAVGIVDQDQIITGQEIQAGDLVIGLKSDGLHSNGFTLARAALFDKAGYDYTAEIEGMEKNLGEELLQPTKIYVKTVLELLDKFKIKGIAHITGGGLIENLPRILPDGLKAEIKKESWQPQRIFKLIQEAGEIAEKEMYRTFNMGIGMTLVIEKNDKVQLLSKLEQMGEKACLIGEIKAGAGDSSLELK
ncbi:phosphoribosylformylglycinamidine cyclo-ligase [Halanaerobium saccharolyticum]|jgi:phosphoribosylformylglycinamidine cyclo-ligase|uniref:Phosphoribosylformylglycinamidine cyclo-ligase n=1 Tax=Halanaerobium saccharolyticum TaxID=43595 RepID=A0A2T5RJP2_9FIRM|nr:phosphoribosylformylglycinamidine cyclo-ligase [Halanaerobium saccharolyticum]PTV98893.1 phosphoribosylformylglycinamidine cyclo-ligase [Halanaerobium saccharolyticum]PUU94831.1 MAG: phosphoribosylformylglycinamidine cyclo-ligase [Halanaerobium sp.]